VPITEKQLAANCANAAKMNDRKHRRVATDRERQRENR
jgi:hypothetical protein